MGYQPSDEKSAAAPEERSRPIVAFDFDGTLTVRDSFIAFLRWRISTRRFVSGLGTLAPAVLRYAADRDRERLKTAAVAVYLRGLSRLDLENEAEAFAADAFSSLIRPDALATWSDWRDRGARLVIVTASPESTVAPFARRLQADDLLGTPLAFDGEDRVTGLFVSPNCRGPEKVARLRTRFGPAVRLAAAYGDTEGDREMLGIAELKGWRVFKGRP